MIFQMLKKKVTGWGDQRNQKAGSKKQRMKDDFITKEVQQE